MEEGNFEAVSESDYPVGVLTWFIPLQTYPDILGGKGDSDGYLFETETVITHFDYGIRRRDILTVSITKLLAYTTSRQSFPPLHHSIIPELDFVKGCQTYPDILGGKGDSDGYLFETETVITRESFVRN